MGVWKIIRNRSSFLFKRWSRNSLQKNKELKKKRDLLVQELNDESLRILTKKNNLERFILERIDQQIELVVNYDFLTQLRKDIYDLHQLDLKCRAKINEIESEYNYIRDLFHDKNETLEEQEIKLCAYFRLGFSTKEISIIERIDLNDVRFYKTCIRRKLKLSTSTSLRDYLVFEE